MEKHFVTFYSPGTFVSEQDERPVETWDAAAAVEMAHEISQRHKARPYGFRFTTRARAHNELDSKVVQRSCLYWLGGQGRDVG